MPLHSPDATQQNLIARSGRRRRESAARHSAWRMLLVAWAAIVWQIAPFAPTASRAQSPQAPVDTPQAPPQEAAPNAGAPPLPSSPQPQCSPQGMLAALPANLGSGSVSNPFTGEILSTPLAICVLRQVPQGDCPAGSTAMSVPGAKGNVCVMPATCASGYALTGTGCCPSDRATPQGLCCPPGQSPQPNGLCGSAPDQPRP
jgi:hypothetical protein